MIFIIYLFIYHYKKSNLDEPVRKRKKGLEVGPFDRNTDWTISNNYSREKILAIIYAGDAFIKMPSRQPTTALWHTLMSFARKTQNGHKKQIC